MYDTTLVIKNVYLCGFAYFGLAISDFGMERRYYRSDRSQLIFKKSAKLCVVLCVTLRFYLSRMYYFGMERI